MKKILILLLFTCSLLLITAEGRQEGPADHSESEEKSPAVTAMEEAASTGTELVHIRMAALKGPTAFGMIKMIDQIDALGDNITLSYELVPTPQDMVAKMTTGQVDIAAMPVNLAAKLYNKMGKKGYRLGASVGDGVLYGLTTREDVESWEDFRGRTVNAIAKGSTPDYLTRYILNGLGLEADKDVNLNFKYSHQQLAQMMAAGKVDNAVLPEPLVSMALIKNPEARIFADMQQEWAEISGTGRNYPISLAVVSPSLTDSEVLKAVFSAYEDSIAWVKDNHEEAASAIEKHGIMPAAMAEKAIDRCNLNFRTPEDVRADLDLFYEVLAGFDPASIGGKLPDEEFYLRY